MYDKKILRRFLGPNFNGIIKDPDSTGKVINPDCGDYIKIYLKVSDNRIKQIKFRTDGCATAIAACDFLCETAKGLTLTEARDLKLNTQCPKMGSVPKARIKCANTSYLALRRAIKDFEENNAHSNI